jgi:predicted ATPase
MNPKQLSRIVLHGFKSIQDCDLELAAINVLIGPNPDNPEQIELQWHEKDDDIPFKAHQLSDGTLRFICLSTVLLQPQALQPEMILIDEPELGLHDEWLSQRVHIFCEGQTEEVFVREHPCGYHLFHRKF